MPPALPIFLAYGDTSGWEILIWLVAGVIGIIGQIATHKQKKEQQARQARSASSVPPPAARPGGGAAPTPDELTEIFKRLGASVPATPPPAPYARQPAPPPPPPQIRLARPPVHKLPQRKPAPHVAPDLARRLARVKQEAEAAAQALESERAIDNAIVPGVQSRAGETRALDTATRHTGAILPRLYAMSMRMSPLPSIPMPGFDRTHHTHLPMRTKLHSRREVRDALIAQTFLQPAKGLAR